MTDSSRIYTRVIATGSALPSHVVTNEELSRELAQRGIETSDEWIRTRTGIEKRYLAEPGLTNLELARRASHQALTDAGIAPESIDLVVFATTTPDGVFPSMACRLAAALGLTTPAAFDVQAVCTGFVCALSVADSMIRTGAYKRALVVGSEVFSRVLDWQDRATCVLFGDGAGALVLEASETPGILAHKMHSDGTKGVDVLALDARIDSGKIVGHPYITMEGRAVFKIAVSAMHDSYMEVCEMAHVDPASVALWIPHQANIRIIEMIGRKIGLPRERWMITVNAHGNTSAASIPLAVDEAARAGRLHTGDLVVLQGVGGGMTWGRTLLQW